MGYIEYKICSFKEEHITYKVSTKNHPGGWLFAQLLQKN